MQPLIVNLIELIPDSYTELTSDQTLPHTLNLPPSLKSQQATSLILSNEYKMAHAQAISYYKVGYINGICDVTNNSLTFNVSNKQQIT